MKDFSENLTRIDAETESHSKNSSRRCAFRVDLLIHALDLNTLDQCRRPVRLPIIPRFRSVMTTYSSKHTRTTYIRPSMAPSWLISVIIQ